LMHPHRHFIGCARGYHVASGHVVSRTTHRRNRCSSDYPRWGCGRYPCDRVVWALRSGSERRGRDLDVGGRGEAAVRAVLGTGFFLRGVKGDRRGLSRRTRLATATTALPSVKLGDSPPRRHGQSGVEGTRGTWRISVAVDDLVESDGVRTHVECRPDRVGDLVGDVLVCRLGILHRVCAASCPPWPADLGSASR
jgi:hypothetical protein